MSRLVLSHVIPRWAAEWHHAERKADEAIGKKPRGSAYRGRPDDEITSVEQDLPKHYMLCGDCERWMSEAERLLKVISVSPADTLIRDGHLSYDEGAGRWRLEGKARRLVQRCLLGTLVRIHYAPSFASRISEREARALCRRVLNDDYGGLIAPSGIKWFGPAVHTQTDRPLNPRPMVLPDITPDRVPSLMLAGFTWAIPTSVTSATQIGAELREYEWTVQIGDVRDSFHVQNYFFNSYVDEGFSPTLRKTAQGWSDSWPCPCGLSKPKGECCSGNWLPRYVPASA